LLDSTVTLLPHSVMGVLPTFNLPASVLATHTPYLPLRVTMETLASIFLGEIRSWTDPRLTHDNPMLAASFAINNATATDNITLVFAGDGSAENAPLSVVSNHFLLALNRTQAFQSDSLLWSLPANFTALVVRLKERGIPFSFCAIPR
jgi:hypothetical protein